MIQEYPIYLFDESECIQCLANANRSFIETVVGYDDEEGGIGYQPRFVFPYNYDYTCEWDASDLYAQLREHISEKDRRAADELFGHLFFFGWIKETANGTWETAPNGIGLVSSISSDIARNLEKDYPTEWHEQAVRLFSPAQVYHLVGLWKSFDGNALFETAREKFPDFKGEDIFESVEDFVEFIQAWTSCLEEANSKKLALLQHCWID